MHISWNFLDKRKAAVEAVEAFHIMDFIIKHADDDIEFVRSRMGGASSPKLDGLPHIHNPQSIENQLLAGIDEIDMLKERYRKAVEYMDWFKPAWEQLSADEQFVLETFLMDKSEYHDAASVVSEHFGIEKSSAYKKKERAIGKITMLLYGKI
jgi:hypothetical protein